MTPRAPSHSLYRLSLVLSGVLALSIAIAAESGGSVKEAERLEDELVALWPQMDLRPIVFKTTRVLELYRENDGPDHPRTAQAWLGVARAHHLSGNLQWAGPLYDLALRAHRRAFAENAPEMAEAYRSIAGYHKDLARWEDARTALSRAEKILLHSYPPEDPAFAGIYSARGHISRRHGEHDEAEMHLRRVLEIQTLAHGEESGEAADAHTWLGWLLWLRGDSDEAEFHLTQGLDLSRRLYGDLDHRTARPAAWLASIHESRGDWAAADSIAAFFDSAERILSPLGLTMTRERHDGDPARILSLVRMGRFDEAWDSHETWKGWKLRAMRSSYERSTPELSEIRNRVFDLERSMGLLRVDGSPANLTENDWMPLLRAEARRIQLSGDLALNEAGRVAHMAVEEARRSLAPGTALVGWVATHTYGPEFDIAVYVLRSDAPLVWVDLNQDQSKQRDWWAPLEDYRDRLLQDAEWPSRVAPDEELQKMARRAGQRLVDPILPHLEGIRKLVIVHSYSPKRAMVPWEILQDPSGAYLVDRFQISYASSATRGVRQQTPSRSRSALVIGDPQFGTATSRSDLVAEVVSFSSPDPIVARSLLAGDLNSFRSLPSLAYAGVEVEAVARCFPEAEVLTGPKATKSELEELRLSGRLQQFDVIHIATHALTAEQRMRGRASLVLGYPFDVAPDRLETVLLSAREIFLGWHLDAELVTLSGCETGVDQRGSKPESASLCQALTRAGARNVLASRWKVDDVATAMLMKRFYESLSGSHGSDGEEPLTLNQALQEAKIWLREHEDEHGNRPFAHPAYWAGFVLFAL